MSLILVEHDTDEPALYGGLAAIAAARLRVGFAHITARFDTARFADAAQHVTAAGALVGSGLVWYERFTTDVVEREATFDAVLARAAQEDVVVPLHPAFSGAAGAELARRTAFCGVAARRYDVVQDRASLRFVVKDTREVETSLGAWSRDTFGRLRDCDTECERSLVLNDEVLRIGLVGAERDHRSAYPAALAALGDAADRLQRTIDVVFIDPPSVRAADVPGILAEVDGLVLPGGLDMINVPGQILMAREALESKKPVVGLCLGMQTMTTAVAQRVLGATRVNLAEADPEALVKTFTAMAGDLTSTEHRLGNRTMRIEHGARLAEYMGEAAQMRFNHRFRFNPALLSDVYRGGLRISAWDETRQIVDAIEAEGHPFYLGFQGHPELSSKPGRPHPVICAFLHACQSKTQLL